MSNVRLQPTLQPGRLLPSRCKNRDIRYKLLQSPPSVYVLPIVRSKSVPKSEPSHHWDINLQPQLRIDGSRMSHPQTEHSSAVPHLRKMSASPKRRPRKVCTKPTDSALLKRKTEFSLHDELTSSPLITIFEEISDSQRIKTICMSTLSAMLGSRKQRQCLYHMNNKAHPRGTVRLLLDCVDASNNASAAEIRKKQMNAERVIAMPISSRTAMMEMSQAKDLRDKRMSLAFPKDDVERASQSKYRIGVLHSDSKFDKLDRATAVADNKFAQGPSFDPTFRKAEKGRKDSARPFDAKLPAKSLRMNLNGKELQIGKFTLGETVEDDTSDNDLATIANVHVSKREQALKLLAEIQLKIEKRQKGNEEDNTGRRQSKSITPEEALQCAWLRLSKTQIATLEELIKQQGKDPGIHAHSDVTNYDVFAEIREIRNREKILKEEDEYKKH